MCDKPALRNMNQHAYKFNTHFEYVKISYKDLSKSWHIRMKQRNNSIKNYQAQILTSNYSFSYYRVKQWK